MFTHNLSKKKKELVHRVTNNNCYFNETTAYVQFNKLRSKQRGFILYFILFNQFVNKGRWQHNRALSPLQGVSPTSPNPTNRRR